MRYPALLLLAALALPACTVQRQVSTPPAYSQASPYAGTPYAAAPAARVIAPAPGSYCEEAVSEAQDASARAAASGTGRDAGRAQRTANYAARDCR